jgi:thiamine phosphate synthase YjbQ (UPF0047 family)
MGDFKVVNSTLTFRTLGEIDFIDLSENIEKQVSGSGIKNGIVHVFSHMQPAFWF